MGNFEKKKNILQVHVHEKKILAQDHRGLIIDCNLNWKKHTHEVGKKISRGIGIVSKLRHFVTIDILTRLYYSLVYPFLSYVLIAWENFSATTLKPVVVLQKKGSTNNNTF